MIAPVIDVTLPPPVIALIEAGRQRLASSQPATIARNPLSPLSNVAIDDMTDYTLRHGMLAWTPVPLGDGVLRQHMTRALEGVRLLQVLTAALADAHIEAVALKGPAFSQWLYGDACARRFSDLDLLVAESQRDAARVVLQQLGFSARVPQRAGDVIYAGIGAWPMDRPGSHTVDLHWRVSGSRYPQVVSVRDVLEHAAEVSLGACAIRVPCAEHTAALILAHAAKHLWYALELPFSIAAMARRPDIDWIAVRRLTVQAGSVRGAAAGLLLASELFHVDLPAPFRPDIALPEVAELCRCAHRTLALPPRTFADRRLERRMHRLAFDRVADRVRYDVRRLLEPTQAEVTWVPLPPSLSVLYWPLRVVRLGVLAVQGVNPFTPSTPG